MNRKAQLRLRALEERIVPAELLHSLFPDPTGPQGGAAFGISVATGSNYRVVGAPGAIALGVDSVGQAFVYDVVTNQLAATLNNPTPTSGSNFGSAVAVSGNYVVVSAFNAGMAYVFNLGSITPTTPIVTLTSPSSPSSNSFGVSVAMSGNLVVVGSHFDKTGASGAGSAFVYDVNSMSPNTPIVTLNNPTPAPNERFGISVGVSGKYVAVGAWADGTGANEAGSAYVYDLNSMSPTTPIVTLNNPAPDFYDHFGISVGVSGNHVVVGAYEDNGGATDAGSAYVYDLNSMTPAIPVVSLNNPAPAIGDRFGVSVAVSGKYVMAGAYNDDAGAANAGSAYIYDLTSATPATPVVTLNNPTPAADDGFAWAVSMWGTDVLVGTVSDDTGAPSAGSGYLYDLGSMTPTTPIAALINPTFAYGDYYGVSVAASGNYVVVGARFDDTGASGAGLAYVYDLSSMTPLTPIATLSNPTPGVNDEFGFSVAVSGTYVVVGAYRDDTGTSDSGSAYVFDLSSPTLTTPIATLNNPSPATNDFFGYSVAASGKYVVVGAFGDDTIATNSGAAYVYDLSSMTPTTPIATLKNPTPVTSDEFGISVAVSGMRVVIGARNDDTGATNAGSAYVYDLNSMTPTTPISTINNPFPGPFTSDNFGNSVAISGNFIVIGAPGNDTAAESAGSAYVYDLSSMTPATPIATLDNPQPVLLDYFGFAVSVSGQYVIVSAYQEPVAGPADKGSARLYDLSSMTPSVPIATFNSPPPGGKDYFGSSVAMSGKFAVVGAMGDDDQNIDQGAVRVYTLSALQVAHVQINGGDPQRSRVTSLAITFDQPVSFSAAPLAAFALKRQGDDAVVDVSATVSGSTVTLTFVGGAVESGSLADGRYTLTIDANQVFNSNGKLDGDANGTAGGNYVLASTAAPNPPTNIFRIFGDSDGDGNVASNDFIQFRLALGGNSVTFDFDNDGAVAASDFIQFRLRFGGSI